MTRNRLAADCLLGSRPFTVVDTGGIESFVDTAYNAQIRSEADLAMEMADVIILVGDAKDGVTPVDRFLAKELRSAQKPVILVVNKIDHAKHELGDTEFSELGFSEILSISAAHGRGIKDLVEEIEKHLPEPTATEAKIEAGVPLKLAIVGRPNVGKSSLINAILHHQRTLVSEVAGTTRDSVASVRTGWQALRLD